MIQTQRQRTLIVTDHVIDIQPAHSDHETIPDRPRVARGDGPQVIVPDVVFDDLVPVDVYLGQHETRKVDPYDVERHGAAVRELVIHAADDRLRRPTGDIDLGAKEAGHVEQGLRVRAEPRKLGTAIEIRVNLGAIRQTETGSRGMLVQHRQGKTRVQIVRIDSQGAVGIPGIVRHGLGLFVSRVGQRETARDRPLVVDLVRDTRERADVQQIVFLDEIAPNPVAAEVLGECAAEHGETEVPILIDRRDEAGHRHNRRAAVFRDPHRPVVAEPPFPGVVGNERQALDPHVQ